MADLLANFPGTSDFSLPQQDVLVTKEQELSMHFNGLSTSQGGGIGVVLKLPGGRADICLQAAFPLFKQRN